MIKLNFFSRIGLILFFFFYLISPHSAISDNLKKDKLLNIENTLNSKKLDLLDEYFEKETAKEIADQFKLLTKDFPNLVWRLSKLKKENAANYILEVKVYGKKSLEKIDYIFNSKFNYVFSYSNGKISNGLIKNHLTTIRSDNNTLDIEVSIPDKVLTGSKYYLDVIVVNPLEEELIAGGLRSHEVHSVMENSITLEPLVSGGLFKETRAPSKPGTQIWSGIIAHHKGLITFTKTVDIVEEF